MALGAAVDNSEPKTNNLDLDHVGHIDSKTIKGKVDEGKIAGLSYFHSFI